MRLFIAVPIEEQIIKNIENFQKRFKDYNFKGIKWVKPEQIHITLKFLGEVKENKTEQIINKLDRINFSDIILNIQNIGGFPNLNKAKVIWAGVFEQNKNSALPVLANKVDNAMNELGFEKEKRKFKSHITVARIKQKPDKKFIDLLTQNGTEKDFGSFTLNQIVLYKSTLLPSGAKYEVLKKIFAKNSG